MQNTQDENEYLLKSFITRSSITFASCKYDHSIIKTLVPNRMKTNKKREKAKYILNISVHVEATSETMEQGNLQKSMRRAFVGNSK